MGVDQTNLPGMDIVAFVLSIKTYLGFICGVWFFFFSFSIICEVCLSAKLYITSYIKFHVAN